MRGRPTLAQPPKSRYSRYISFDRVWRLLRLLRQNYHNGYLSGKQEKKKLSC
jgi:hypothetical protein